MLSESELISLIRNSPALKELLDLPGRVAGLEKQIAELRATKSKRERSFDPCPTCGGYLALTDEKPHPIFGVAGGKVRTFKCQDCGRTVERDYDPPSG